MSCSEYPSTKELRQHECLERADNVPHDRFATAFKRRARLHQALWRERKEIRIGSQPIRPTKGEDPRPLGSRINMRDAYRDGSNFLGEPVRRAVESRLSRPERHQMLSRDRLYCDLLSSMPMCFNLFGWLHDDVALATEAVKALWPDAPGRVKAVRFEWSPGRADPDYLENRSAFDAAFELALDDGNRGIIGIETKYHEHCKPERKPKKDRRDRYETVTRNSGEFKPHALRAILGTDLQQIWLDHLLALSMLQHTGETWCWARFVLVYPRRNPSFSNAGTRYSELLSEPRTFELRTLESILAAGALSHDQASAFRKRYLW